MSFKVEVDSDSVHAALNRILQANMDMSPVLRALGEDIAARAKHRFDTLTAPDGTKWQSNTQATIIAYLNARGGINAEDGQKGKRDNVPDYELAGKINRKGEGLAINKKPLHGHSGDLAQQIDYAVTEDSVTVAANPVYAAMMQFGGEAASYPALWGDIPARPFLPVQRTGQLYPEEERDILDRLNEYLQQAIG